MRRPQRNPRPSESQQPLESEDVPSRESARRLIHTDELIKRLDQEFRRRDRRSGPNPRGASALPPPQQLVNLYSYSGASPLPDAATASMHAAETFSYPHDTPIVSPEPALQGDQRISAVRNTPSVFQTTDQVTGPGMRYAQEYPSISEGLSGMDPQQQVTGLDLGTQYTPIDSDLVSGPLNGYTTASLASPTTQAPEGSYLAGAPYSQAPTYFQQDWHEPTLSTFNLAPPSEQSIFRVRGPNGRWVPMVVEWMLTIQSSFITLSAAMETGWYIDDSRLLPPGNWTEVTASGRPITPTHWVTIDIQADATFGFSQRTIHIAIYPRQPDSNDTKLIMGSNLWEQLYQQPGGLPNVLPTNFPEQ
ncbi:hypothetical protein FDECE_5418 [Fusarium decemcellulare]|nr:hypothetical protein FDECE_5418 [Fusarium decemcellulare]